MSDSLDPAEMVRISIMLDLAYDEETKSIAPPGELKGLRPCPPQSRPSDMKGWWKRFRRLKALRVRDGLEFDRQRRAFAMRGGDGAQLWKIAKRRNDNLESIVWQCATAIDYLRRCIASTESGDAQTQWATLLALFHSELCASAAPDVSLGTASRYQEILVGVPLGKGIFEWAAWHNVARGQNHIHRPVDALRMLDTWVDRFESEVDPTGCADRFDVGLLRRLLYFPMCRTLAQSLSDLGRHVESVYYLTRANETAKKSEEYWRCVLSIDLEAARSASGLEASRSEKQPQWPRAASIHWERRCDNMADLAEWEVSEIRLLRWHAAEPRALGRRLARMADEVRLAMEQHGKSARPPVLRILIKARDVLEQLGKSQEVNRVQLEPDHDLGVEIWQTFCDLRGARPTRDAEEVCHDGEYILATPEQEHRS